MAAPAIDYEKLPHFHMVDKLTNALMAKTGQYNGHFFNILSAYCYSLIAANMSVSIDTKDRGLMPVNMYAISLADSGFGKGHSVSILTETVMKDFMQQFMEVTVPLVTQTRLNGLATSRANRNGTSEEEELPGVMKDFTSCGPYLPVFDSGTAPAFKQLRAQILMSGIGCLHMRTDEIGNNLKGIQDILTAFIEAFDVGIINPKLIKHTKEQERVSVDHGRTPPMWLAFGTPVKLLDGGAIEAEFMDNLQTGLARRSFFGLCIDATTSSHLTAAEVFAIRTDSGYNNDLDQLGAELAHCADISNHKLKLLIDEDLSIKLIDYEMRNKQLAAELPAHSTIERAELLHRHAKVLKLAGAYAFVNGDFEITEETLFAAIRMAEDSGAHFKLIMQREPAHVRLAKYIGTMGIPLTQAELVEQLPYFKGSESVRRDMLTMAIAAGLRMNISIAKHYTNGVEEVVGTMLQPTDITNMTFSYSTDITEDYRPATCTFANLPNMVLRDGLHWAVHSFKQGHRHADNAIKGFNMLVLDVDDGMSIATAKLLLQEYTYCIHTTKSHGLIEGEGGAMIDKFRVIIPLSHTLKLDPDDYSAFMDLVFDSLPFGVDTQTKNISRKWMTNAGQCWMNEGKMWDVTPFIPSTTLAEEQRERTAELYSLSHIERWFMNCTGKGNRSNNLFRFGQMLLDSGKDIGLVRDAVAALNEKLPDKLEDDELNNTIFRTLTKASLMRDKADE